MQENHYHLLNVTFAATRAEITVAYRRQMREWHPDNFPGDDKSAAEEYSKRLNLAYSILSNPHKRAEYDRSIRVEALQQQIMERYVAGASGWNMGGGTSAEAPRRPMSARERREIRISDRNAARSMFVSFALLALAGILLLVVFTLLDAVFRGIT